MLILCKKESIKIVYFPILVVCSKLAMPIYLFINPLEVETFNYVVGNYTINIFLSFEILFYYKFLFALNLYFDISLDYKPINLILFFCLKNYFDILLYYKL